MSLKILDKPLSLHARSIAIGLRAHYGDPDFPKQAIASCDHLKLIEYKRKHPGTKRSLVWAIMDGFYLLSDSYKSIIKLPELLFIDHIFVVGDCGSLDQLRIASSRPDLKLLLGSQKLMPLIKRLQHASPFTRISYQVPPALLYETWDLAKDFGSTIPCLPQHSPLFFAGNDGLKGIKDVLEATGSIRLLEHYSALHPTAYQEILFDHLNKNASLHDLAFESLEYFNKLGADIEDAVGIDKQMLDSQKIARILCLKALLFKSILRKSILSWLHHNQLAVVITNPRLNKSFYAYRRLNSAIMLDLGGLNGFEQIYPRTLDCFLYNKKILSVNDDLRSSFKAIQAGNINSTMDSIANIESRLSQPHFENLSPLVP